MYPKCIQKRTKMTFIRQMEYNISIESSFYGIQSEYQAMTYRHNPVIRFLLLGNVMVLQAMLQASTHKNNAWT